VVVLVLALCVRSAAVLADPLHADSAHAEELALVHVDQLQADLAPGVVWVRAADAA
jgi:hypothetical protein